MGLRIGHFQGGQHRLQPLGPRVRSRDLERHARVGDLAFGAGQPLRQRGLGHQERRRDLRDGEAADEAQGKRGPGLDRHGRMATDEDQPQALVRDQAGVGGHQLLRGGRGRRPIRLQPLARAPPAQHVQRRALGGPVEPRGRIGRLSSCRPGFERPRAGFGEGVLGQVEVAITGGERGDDPAARLPRRLIERSAGHPMSGRISTEPSR